jgi:hypothetical protein
MMVSFLATLEGSGVAFEGEELARASTAEDQAKRASGRIGLPAISALFGIDLTGRLESGSKEEESRETKVLRRHTEASLFNLLRHRLLGEDRVHQISDPDTTNILPGNLVEFEGEYVGNALQEIVDLFLKLLPYTDLEEEAKKQKKKNSKRSGNPAVRAAAEQQGSDDGDDPAEILQMMRIVHDDLEGSAVEDVVLQGANNARAVLTLSREFLSPDTQQQMMSARLRVIGKVSRVLRGSEMINLLRRTALGVTGPGAAQELVSSITEMEGAHISVGDPVVKAPAVQIQPLAVYL